MSPKPAPPCVRVHPLAQWSGLLLNMNGPSPTPLRRIPLSRLLFFNRKTYSSAPRAHHSRDFSRIGTFLHIYAHRWVKHFRTGARSTGAVSICGQNQGEITRLLETGIRLLNIS
jgi:hypothetical protein